MRKWIKLRGQKAIWNPLCCQQGGVCDPRFRAWIW